MKRIVAMLIVFRRLTRRSVCQIWNMVFCLAGQETVTMVIPTRCVG